MAKLEKRFPSLLANCPKLELARLPAWYMLQLVHPPLQVLLVQHPVNILRLPQQCLLQAGKVLSQNSSQLPQTTLRPICQRRMATSWTYARTALSSRGRHSMLRQRTWRLPRSHPRRPHLEMPTAMPIAMTTPCTTTPWQKRETRCHLRSGMPSRPIGSRLA